MYLLPQEVEVWYILPKIRKELAIILVKDFDWTYDSVGDCLGISKAAVSQYISNKRANKISLSKDVSAEIKKSAKLIFEKKSSGMAEILRILAVMKSSKEACQVCKRYNKDVLKYCNATPKY
jgi:predicted transcriptional regulator